MSHFSLLVKIPVGDWNPATIGDSAEAVLEPVMAPFNEQTEDSEFIEFEEMEPEELAKGDKMWREGTSEYGDTKGKKYRDGYATFAEFVMGYYGYGRRDEADEDSPFGRWFNPNAKWDWWVIGGRWKAMLPVRKGGTGWLWNNGPSGFDEQKPNPGALVVFKRVDMAALGDVDFALDEGNAEWDANEFYDKAERLVAINSGRKTRMQTDDDIVLGFDVGSRMVTRGLARWDGRGSGAKFVLKPHVTREYFVKNHKNMFYLTTFAVLDSDGWHEPGTMGWFGCDNASADKKVEFESTFHESFIDGEDTGTLLVVVDCHI